MFLTFLGRLIFVHSKTCGRELWAKSNLKKGIFIDSLISFLVPDVSLLSEPFKEDILRLLEANAPTRRRILKINDKDVCKLSFGYVFFGVHSCLGTLYGSFISSTAIRSLMS